MFYDQTMRRPNAPAKTKHRETQVPVFIERDEDGFYVVECPLFEGCYSQGKTVDEALRNIREVIQLVLEEERNRDILNTYHLTEMGLHTITLQP
jgi:predicted RNase H-like HicB family nuclease